MSAKSKVTALDIEPLNKLDDDLQGYFDTYQEKLGFVPNVMRAFAFDNTKLRAFIDMGTDLMQGESGLSKLEREMIATAVSSVNHCHYCLTSHGWGVRFRAGDPEFGEVIVQNYRAANLDKRQKAMLDFAVKMTSHPAEMEEEDRENLRQVGFSERDIWDIAAVAGFYNMSNRIAAACDIQPNAEYHYMAREKS